MDCSTAGSSAFHYLLEFAQIHVHWVSDATWPSFYLNMEKFTDIVAIIL